ncbi:putative phage tail protein [Sporosarcina contaminans]|uniref:Phage tail protein n=1 Tax=Sporosarcina contaminans TaxID=633403 RepID=A0ABW3TSY8_9BACL
MSRLLDHLPALYKDIREFRELSGTVSKEYDGLEASFQQVENDQFVMTSSEPAIERREKQFSIVPDKTVETLPFRKRRLLTRMQDNPPYTDEYLKELLDSLLGQNMTQIERDVVKLELEALVHVESASFYLEVLRILERLVPLNVTITTAVLLIKEFLVLRSKAYGFEVIHPRTGKMRTASVPGMGREVEKGTMESAAYSFPVNHPRTNKMRTASVPGIVADETGFTSIGEAYAFAANYPVTGKMITGKRPKGVNAFV